MSALCQPDEQLIEEYVEWVRLSQLVDFIKECKVNPKDNEPKLVDEVFVRTSSRNRVWLRCVNRVRLYV